MMKVGRVICAAAPLLLLLLLSASQAAQAQVASLHFRPPAIPLITADPYMQSWLRGDNATAAPVCYWNGAKREMRLLLRVDGTTYAALGACAVQPPSQPGPATRCAAGERVGGPLCIMDWMAATCTQHVAVDEMDGCSRAPPPLSAEADPSVEGQSLRHSCLCLCLLLPISLLSMQFISFRCAAAVLSL